MLNELRKKLEKQIIRLCVASPSHATSQNRKSMTRETKKRSYETLKKESTSYKESFSSSAKGQWVDEAKKTVQTLSD
ncbi:hypothetical protein [Carnobacterium divergens]|uniref:hypothetical protein n=1 Tax=Carnobacterium divergens TaxID=2748 RepID=UPI002890F9C7|nr:hypothetical protein [Carnobacterium divergens]MDT2012598.1 hypothetical protein [Carnobacterium divergens]